ncbi:MAG: hypothetical protein ACK56F_25405, partial [bacterium]
SSSKPTPAKKLDPLTIVDEYDKAKWANGEGGYVEAILKPFNWAAYQSLSTQIIPEDHALNRIATEEEMETFCLRFH